MMFKKGLASVSSMLKTYKLDNVAKTMKDERFEAKRGNLQKQ